MDEPLVIVGLGNPGPKYETSRHNIGFMVVDALTEKLGVSLRGEAKFEANMGSVTLKGQKIWLVEPVTFMNLSGQSVQKLARFYKIPYERFLVLYDDIDLPLGRIRFRPDGSAGSHNGMKSILQETGNAAIPRLRVGVGAPPPEWDLADYVLAPFPESEMETVNKVVELCVKATQYWLKHDTPMAMNHYNSTNLLAQPKVKKEKPPKEEAPTLEDKPAQEA